MTRIFELIGAMLGSEQVWSEGVVEVGVELGTPEEEFRSERFWQARGSRWRFERSDGLAATEHIGVEGRHLVGGKLDVGPSHDRSLGTYPAAMLIQPRRALIWGRRGEDWRPTGDWHTLSTGLVEMALERTDVPDVMGFARVDPETGIIHELSLESRSYVLSELCLYDRDGRGEEWITGPLA